MDGIGRVESGTETENDSGDKVEQLSKRQSRASVEGKLSTNDYIRR